MTDNKNQAEELDPDGPGDFYHPFSELRATEPPRELRITRATLNKIARAAEDSSISKNQKLEFWVGSCLGAIWLLEQELVAYRRAVPGGPAGGV